MIVRNAPLPMGYAKGVRRAAELQRSGLTWTGVAVVMREYHGLSCSGDYWRRLVDRAGLEFRRFPGKSVAMDRRWAEAKA